MATRCTSWAVVEHASPRGAMEARRFPEPEVVGSIPTAGVFSLCMLAPKRGSVPQKLSPSWVRTSDLQVNSLTRYRLRHGGCVGKDPPPAGLEPATTRLRALRSTD